MRSSVPDDPGDFAVWFFGEYLRHWKGEWAGQPFELSEWQDEFVRRLFGTIREDGTRQYRTAYVEIPRKNGKSTLCAGLALFLLMADDEPGAEIYSCAADRDQAAIVFECAREMVEAHPALKSRVEVYRRSIVFPAKGSSYKVLSADAYTKHGLNAHAVIFDELHAQPNRELWDVMQTSMGSRRQPLMMAITTAGYDRNSICYEVHDYAEKVQAGLIEDSSFLPLIYAAGEGDDWNDREVWARANPNLGISVKREFLEQEYARARELPGYENTFKRLFLNIWTEQHTRWLPMETWRACPSKVNPKALEGKTCYAGLDLSSTTDISALVLVFPRSGGVDVLPFFWIPEESIQQRVRRDRVPYDVWTREGHIETTEGNVIDHEHIRRRVNELGEKYKIAEIAIDRWNSTQLQVQLEGDGFTVVPFGQGTVSMSAPSKELEKLVLGRMINHGGNPVLDWMASNVSIRTNAAGDIKPDKERSTERIDGIVALIMGLGRALVQPENMGSVYSRRGLRML